MFEISPNGKHQRKWLLFYAFIFISIGEAYFLNKMENIIIILAILMLGEILKLELRSTGNARKQP